MNRLKAMVILYVQNRSIILGRARHFGRRYRILK